MGHTSDNLEKLISDHGYKILKSSIHYIIMFKQQLDALLDILVYACSERS